MLAHPIKASDVSHLTDARYFSAWEVEYIGFNLGPEGISSTELAAMLEWIQGPKFIGELDAGLPGRLTANEAAQTALSNTPVDGFQVDAIFGVDNIKQLLSPLNRPVFLEFTVEGYADLDTIKDVVTEHASVVEQILLNFKKGGIQWQDLLAGQPISIDALAQMTEQFAIWMEIDGALPSEIMAALPSLKGLSVRGGSEEKVGFKDFDDLADFFEDLEVEG